MPPPLENTAARARALAHEAGELRTQLSRSAQRQEEAVRLVRELSDANAALKAELVRWCSGCWSSAACRLVTTHSSNTPPTPKQKSKASTRRAAGAV